MFSTCGMMGLGMSESWLIEIGGSVLLMVG